MTEATEGRLAFGQEATASRPDAGDTGVQAAGKASGTAGPSGTTTATGQAGATGPSEAVLGPFTLREAVFGGGVVLVFIGTLLPFIDGMVRYANFWNSGPLFFIGIGILLPVIALALLAGRRLGSTGLRVGSLSVDQFASVTAVLAATYFFLQTVTDFHPGPLLALIGSLAMLAATVTGPFLPVFRNDFAERPEVPAHAAARPITAARPRPAKQPEAGAKTRQASTTSGTGKAGVNPAAAAVLQNGAGLYGAGGAGAVGAGAAASGQSGMERGASQGTSTDDAPVTGTTPAADPSGSSAVGQGSEATVENAGLRAAGSSDPNASHAIPSQSATDVTRVHEVVRDDLPGSSSAEVPEERSHQEPITATRFAEEEPVVEAFWFAVGSPRPVVDEQTGREVFTLQPGDWEVGIEDRGSEFLVQDKRTGSIGILRDLRNIERAPRD
ncbi:hypothetical protein MN0502_28010 [Arthrobacter sp. MN05-02]|nr:hypothetical protein MN0502_28010 [Arthrobacter sp. MN05-02]